MNKVLLIDGNSLMFRSFYATAYTGNLMQNSKGLYTNAIFGFCNMMTKLLDEDVDKVFVAFDKGKQTFRHLEYSDYKGGRKPLPEEFRVQIPYIKKYLDTINVKHSETFDFEADDLLASVASVLKKDENNDIYVITGDKDLLQLVDSNVKVALTKKGISELDLYTKDNFKEKMGFYSYQIPDYKGLVGDSSDNLPGIKGIGEKTALKLLEEYGSIENIIENCASLKGKVKEVVSNFSEIGLKCKRLATLRYDAPLDFTESDLEKKDINIEDVIELFKELEFYSLLKRIEKNKTIENDSNTCEKQEQLEKQNLEYIIAGRDYDFSNFTTTYIVSEIFKEDYYNGICLGFSVVSGDANIYIDFCDAINNPSFITYLESDFKKHVFDYKKIYVILKKQNITINNVVFDSFIATYLINPSFASEDIKADLEHFVLTDLLYDDTVYGYKSKAAVPDIDVIAKHSIAKANAIKNTESLLKEKMHEYDQEYLFSVELSLSKVLGDMELNGLKVNRSTLQEVEKDLSQRLQIIEHRIYDITGEVFNINSVKQLGEVLFEKLHLPTGKKNKRGYSTSSDVLEKLAPNFEIARLILEYRTLSKIISTYVYGMYDVMNEKDFVHPLYKQCLTLTGRLSCTNPNIQNIPIRTEEGQVIRKAFISRFENGHIMSLDYSQIELRVLACLAEDEVMIDAFNSGEDFHTATASWLYNVNIGEVTKDMRRTAKAINFGIVYGMSAWGLSESIHISSFDANMYIGKYFEVHKKVREYLDKTIMNAKINGYTKTMYNRLRYIPELQSSNKNLSGFGERTAMNSPIQGTAADIIKIAMVKVSDAIKNMKSKLIAQVHDELVFDVYESEEKELEKIVKDAMENVIKLQVKLICDCEIGKTWFDA